MRVDGRGKYCPWELDSDTVQQIWAEVCVLAKAGERLFLPPELESYAKEEHRRALGFPVFVLDGPEQIGGILDAIQAP